MSAEAEMGQGPCGADDANIERLHRALASIIRLLGQRATLGTIASRCGYHLPQASWALLEYLEARGAMRVSDVAACYGVDISTVTPRLKALEKTGMVTRTRGAEDGRVSIIEISDKGRLALSSVRAAQKDVLVQALSEGNISATDMLGAVTLLEYLAQKLGSDRRLPAS